MAHRYMLLEKRYRKKVADDKKASGTSPNHSEVDILLEEIVALFDEADQVLEFNKRKILEEAPQAEEMRDASLETFKQTKDRQDETPKAKKKRASAADSMAFIKERPEVESQQRAGDTELRRQQLQMEKEAREADLKLRAKKHEERVEQQQNTAQFHQQQLQQMQNMNMVLLQQQQQQTQALMSLLQKFAEK